jgi:nucleoid DNA-binding protein
MVEMTAEQNGFARNKSIKIVENLISIIKQTLESGEDMLVNGFGKCYVIQLSGLTSRRYRPAVCARRNFV